MKLLPEDWLPVLLPLGEALIAHPDRRHPRRKNDGSWVTEADTHTDKVWQEWAKKVGLGYLGEELVADFLSTRLWDQDMLIVDPIDGTAPYTNGLPTWGMSLGLARKSRFWDGVLFLPETQTLLWSDADSVRHYEGEWKEIDPRILRARSEKIETPKSPTEHGMIAVSQVLSKYGQFKSGRYVLATASSVFSLAQLMLGRCVGYISSGCVWDFAGALPLLDRLNFAGKFYRGDWLDLRDIWSIFTQDHHLVARKTIILGVNRDIVLEIEEASVIQ